MHSRFDLKVRHLVEAKLPQDAQPVDLGLLDGELHGHRLGGDTQALTLELTPDRELLATRPRLFELDPLHQTVGKELFVGFGVEPGLSQFRFHRGQRRLLGQKLALQVDLSIAVRRLGGPKLKFHFEGLLFDLGIAELHHDGVRGPPGPRAG